ncbi:disulfide bond formation protein B [Sporolactobacillus nakayamae]|uniref:disulfide bond formation protein B n=1 Tax=Sporolactobacillus nakayamae TaxID=269670 RepID=UPI0011606FA0|nr:disulfide bond formation protein B [Sporolactobacillus nakayamae]
MPNHFLLLVALIVAIVATGGRLYFSEFMHLVPCTLCWYQCILMYPFVISIGIACFLFGFYPCLLSLYHSDVSAREQCRVSFAK